MKHRWERPIAAILALLAVGVYSLCCKPAWSPKGDQVAYISSQDVNEQARWVVAIYDLATKQSRVVAETKAGDDSRLVPMEVFWPKCGHEIVYASAPEDSDKEGAVQVSTCNLQTGAVKESKRIAVPTASAISGVGPVFMQGKRWLWLQSDEGCFRVDLDKGKASRLKRAKVPLKQGGKLFYAGEASEKGIEFGRIKTLFSLKEQPLFTVTPEKEEGLTPLTGMPERCTRFACISKSDTAKRLRVYDDSGKCLKTIPLPEQTDFGKDVILCSEWSPDGGTVWLTLKGTDSGVEYTGLAEIRVADGNVRIIKINNNNEFGDLKPLQPSLSPSSAWLAVSTLQKETVGLCLVDLTSNARTATFASPPKPGSGG